jgi:uncharacterized protein (TIGR02118 family)
LSKGEAMFKSIAPAIINPGTRSLAAFHTYWAQSHGPLFSNTQNIWGYVQHLTLPEAYDGTPKPTHDGASMFWHEDLDAFGSVPATAEARALREAVLADDRQLFDRLPGWPLHHKRATVIASERVVVDGETTPEMVKLIVIAARMPGLTPQECSDHWFEVHGPLAATLPGLRRYVQNHAVPDMYTRGRMTHDGWSELWFDDLASLRAAFASPQAEALRADGETLFARPMARVIAKERVQKWDGVSRTDLSWVKAMSEDEIRARLEQQGFASLAADPAGPGNVKAAAESGSLMVWSPEHIVTVDDAHIDARPGP